MRIFRDHHRTDFYSSAGVPITYEALQNFNNHFFRRNIFR